MSTTPELLNAIFNKKSIGTFIKGNIPDCFYLAKYLPLDNQAKYIDVFNGLFTMCENARNEACYIYNLFDCVRKKAAKNNSNEVCLTQLWAGKSILDFVEISGSNACVYEIKTHLDSYLKLERQLCDYYKIFTNVCVFVPQCNVGKLLIFLQKMDNQQIAPFVGVYTFSDEDDSIVCYQSPITCVRLLDYPSMFNVLRKKEYSAIIKKHCDVIPRECSCYYYRDSLNIFKTIPILSAQRFVVEALGSRNNSVLEVPEDIPMYLRPSVYFLKMKNKYDRLKQRLQECYVNK